MGYYSDVAIAIKSSDFEKLTSKFYDKHGDTFTDTFNFYTESAFNSTVIHIGSVKWYDWFADVRDCMETLREGDIPYKFIRVGEEAGDVEEEQSEDADTIDANLEVVTSIGVYY